MRSIPWRVCASAALLPLAAAVHAAPADPTNAAASVPVTRYESAFKNYQPAIDASAPPDKGWRAANDAVAAKAGEGAIPGMQMGDSKTMPMPAGAGAPKPSGKTMAMPDGRTMPMEPQQTTPMDKGMQLPTEQGVKAPADQPMNMPDGSTMPMEKNMTMPIPENHRSMPGMDLSPGHAAKGHGT